jgi:hypothetical protein
MTMISVKLIILGEMGGLIERWVAKSRRCVAKYSYKDEWLRRVTGG